MEILLIYLGIGVVVVGLGVLVYVFAVASRRRYVCPKCGERVKVEHMRASRCNMCGAALVGENGS